MKNKLFISAFTIFLFNFTIFAANSIEKEENLKNGVIRYAIYVGANDGGKERERLLYAGTDAQAFKKAMTEIGGVEEENSRILINPSKNNIDEAISEVSDKINSNADVAKRSEFIFYYSGHSDENALLLGETVYDYSELKAAISEVPSDIHVVILDSCYSGNFIRTKGGQKRKPFLIDDSAVVKGHAYLSSSSESEFSQESDEIESSYFTNAMISGLRGAADTSGDNKVTLNELYSYAFNETLAKTENSKAGPQHPNYNITLVGSGDLVLSDLSTAESMLSFSKESKGRFIIRDKNEKLVAEINKTEGQPIFMALPAGEYFAVVIDGNSTKQGSFTLEKDNLFVIDDNSFGKIKRKSGRVRGDFVDSENKNLSKYDTDNSDVLGVDDLDNYENSQNYLEQDSFDENNDKNDDFEEEFDINSVNFSDFDVFHFQPVPAISVTGNAETAIISVGLFGSIESAMMTGSQISTIMNIAPAMKFGVQTSGLFNINSWGLGSVQVAGLFNISNTFSGAQVSGLFNVADEFIGNQTAGLFNVGSRMIGLEIAGGANFSTRIEGGQIAGFMNVSDRVSGAQMAGFMNITDEVQGVQIAGFMNIADKVNGLQLGVINIADEINGVALGLFNFVDNGLADISVAWNSDNFVDFYYQGGAKYLYSITGVLVSEKSFSNNSFDMGAVYCGIGSQFDLVFFRCEVELLQKQYCFNYNNEEYSSFFDYLNNLKIENFGEFFSSLTVPSLRLNAHLQFGNFGSIFGSAIFDVNVKGWNDLAFSLYHREKKMTLGDSFEVYPNFQFGFRIHL